MKHPITRLLLADLLMTIFLWIATPAMSQTPSQVIPVWDGVAPGSENWTQKEGLLDLNDPRFNPPNPDTLVWNVTRPTLAVFKPAPGKANNAAVIIAPGGGFRVLSYKNEGLRVAQWFADRGVTAFVLKYRLNRMPDDPAAVRKGLDQMMAAASARPAGNPLGASVPSVPMPSMGFGSVELAAISDGQQAVKLVRGRAKEFGIDPQRIGIIGFSAGGAVSGGAAVRAEPADRPSFVGVIYANVPGAIPAQAPPAFFAAAADDPLSSAMPDLFTRWRASGASAEIHIYAKGQHGFGTAKQGLPVDHWLDSFYAWLGQQGFVPGN
jgi:acetyl esterase/lipase